jgi:putative two-component system response regulator
MSQDPTLGGLTGTRTSRVLVVDDLEPNRELLEAYLTAAGYEVTLACDGQEAIESVASQSPDIVLLDIQMPRLNGYDVCRALKEDDRTRMIPVVMITALSELEDKIRGIEAGADDFLTKPFNKLEMLTRVKSLLRVKHLNDEVDGAQDIILTLAKALEAKDEYTRGHSERVGEYTAQLGRRLGMSARDQNLLRRAGILHDLGKIGVSRLVLHKTEPLTDPDWQVIRSHPARGRDICSSLKSTLRLLPIIAHHHERYDGKGYPDGLAGEAIPAGARMMAVADAYDAMTSDRPYRGRMPREEAIRRLLEGRGSYWDPAIVTEFISLLGENRP